MEKTMSGWAARVAEWIDGYRDHFLTRGADLVYLLGDKVDATAELANELHDFVHEVYRVDRRRLGGVDFFEIAKQYV